jgi:hypothetical protein
MHSPDIAKQLPVGHANAPLLTEAQHVLASASQTQSRPGILRAAPRTPVLNRVARRNAGPMTNPTCRRCIREIYPPRCRWRNPCAWPTSAGSHVQHQAAIAGSGQLRYSSKKPSRTSCRG